MEEPKKAPKTEPIAGEHLPKLSMDALARLLSELHEFYVKTDSLILLTFEGQVEDGAVQIPQHAHDALNGKKALVGVLWTPKEPAPQPSANGSGTQ